MQCFKRRLRGIKNSTAVLIIISFCKPLVFLCKSLALPAHWCNPRKLVKRCMSQTCEKLAEKKNVKRYMSRPLGEVEYGQRLGRASGCRYVTTTCYYYIARVTTVVPALDEIVVHTR